MLARDLQMGSLPLPSDLSTRLPVTARSWPTAPGVTSSKTIKASARKQSAHGAKTRATTLPTAPCPTPIAPASTATFPQGIPYMAYNAQFRSLEARWTTMTMTSAILTQMTRLSYGSDNVVGG